MSGCTVSPMQVPAVQSRFVRLVHGHRTVASGRGDRLRADRRLAKGNYVLVIGQGEHAERLQAVVR